MTDSKTSERVAGGQPLRTFPWARSIPEVWSELRAEHRFALFLNPLQRDKYYWSEMAPVGRGGALLAAGGGSGVR